MRRRIARADGGQRAAAELAVYTPGSRSGLPVNALGSFAPPGQPKRAGP